MAHPRLSFVLGALGALAVFTAEHEAGAGDWWYMKGNCFPDASGVVDWGFNQFGYYNSNTDLYSGFYCGQPHLWGGAGYAGAEVDVWDHNATYDFDVRLYRVDDSGFPYPAYFDEQWSSATGFQRITFPANTDSTTYMYYFHVDVPPVDSTPGLGASNLVSIFFQFN